MGFADQIAIIDPRDRLIEQLRGIDDTIERANKRHRYVNGGRYDDPDGSTVIKARELGAKLVNEYHARALSSVESIGTLDRAQAIAELEAVLEAWKDPRVTDEQWRASRIAPVVTEKPAVRRGRPPKRQP